MVSLCVACTYLMGCVDLIVNSALLQLTRVVVENCFVVSSLLGGHVIRTTATIKNNAIET